MRLLNVETRQLQEFFEDRTPSYAILSHTWGEDEVSYQDLISNPDYRQLAGHYKLEKCCEATVRDGLEWVSSKRRRVIGFWTRASLTTSPPRYG